MFEPLIALGLFGGLVWVIAHAIFMLVHGERGEELFPEHRDTLAKFVEENYGARFVSENPLGEEGMRRL
jgi:hypothetical protein